ncbi:MAG: hypothetical protein AAGB24_13060 [Bacteroidota bacterium]
MKNILSLLLAVLFLSLVACSNDDDGAVMDMEEEVNTLQLPSNITVTNSDIQLVVGLEVRYDTENRPVSIDVSTETGVLQSTISINYNQDTGLISTISLNEIDPSPFSTTFNFSYEESVLTTIQSQVDDSSFFNILPVEFDAATNTYTISDGGSQVYQFDDENNLVSYTASDLSVWDIVHGATNPGLFKGVDNQVALGIILPLLNFNVSVGLYLLSTKQINAFSFGSSGMDEVNTLVDEDGLITGIEVSAFGSVFLRTEITYQTIEL